MAAATDIKSPEALILQWQSNASKTAVRNMKFSQDRDEIQHLLDAVDELKKCADSSATTLLATQIAMSRLKDEFRSILVSVSPVKNRLQSDPSSMYTDSEYSWYTEDGMNRNTDIIPDEAMTYLRAIAERMISAGNSGECIEVYVSVRKTGVDEWFQKLQLGTERMSSENIQRLEWEVQEKKIRLWVHGATICVRWLFAGERTLSDQIFKGLGTKMADDCFMKTVKDSAITLFNFAEAITRSRRTPEKLFKILDLYDVLSSLLPDINAIFRLESGELIRKQAVDILSSLSEAAKGILLEFEKAVFGEISRVSIWEVSVHPLTKYVMNYIDDIVEHEQTLNQLIVSNPSSLDHVRSSALEFDFSEFEGKASPLVLHLIWIIVALKFNLQDKSKQYRYFRSVRLFKRNNVHYIVQRIKGSVELRKMIGHDYQKRLVSMAKANYRNKTWKRRRILNCFRCSSFGEVKNFYVMCKWHMMITSSTTVF